MHTLLHHEWLDVFFGSRSCGLHVQRIRQVVLLVDLIAVAVSLDYFWAGAHFPVHAIILEVSYRVLAGYLIFMVGTVTAAFRHDIQCLIKLLFFFFLTDH